MVPLATFVGKNRYSLKKLDGFTTICGSFCRKSGKKNPLFCGYTSLTRQKWLKLPYEWF
jgi:hypothetical protein